MNSKLLNVAEVAEYLSLSSTKVRQLARKGNLKSSNLADSNSDRAIYRFRKEWVDEFVNNQIIETTPAPLQSYRTSQKPNPGDRY